MLLKAILITIIILFILFILTLGWCILEAGSRADDQLEQFLAKANKRKDRENHA